MASRINKFNQLIQVGVGWAISKELTPSISSDVFNLDGLGGVGGERKKGRRVAIDMVNECCLQCFGATR